jgi:hypothetical protein
MRKGHVLGRKILASLGSREVSGSSHALHVCVPFTTSDLTRAALNAAVALTRNLGARVSLVAVLIVPFPLPLDRPAVSPRVVERELQGVARDIELELNAHVVIARDREEAFRRAISRGSLVVLATKKRWWPARQVKRARLLARAGHSVALLEI